MTSAPPIPGSEGGLRNANEKSAASEIIRIFEQSKESTSDKLIHFAKYIRRQDLTRLLARYEIFRRILTVKGSVIECGVYKGSGLMSWANFSAILEPANLTRRIYGFDSFAGFPEVGEQDRTTVRQTRPGELHSGCYEELLELIAAYDANRFLGHVPKVELIKGDATKTIPRMLETHPHLVISLLFLDFDLYEPTMAALKTFLPRIPRGGIIAFDELDNPAWPGETLAAIEAVGLGQLRLQRSEFDPYVSYSIIE